MTLIITMTMTMSSASDITITSTITITITITQTFLLQLPSNCYYRASSLPAIGNTFAIITTIDAIVMHHDYLVAIPLMIIDVFTCVLIVTSIDTSKTVYLSIASMITMNIVPLTVCPICCLLMFAALSLYC